MGQSKEVSGLNRRYLPTMNMVVAWFRGRRVFPRWKLFAMVLTAVLSGMLIAMEEYVLAILCLFSVFELTKRGSD